MIKSSQIKTHFDIKIILLFISIFIFSCILIIYKKKIQSICTVDDFKVVSSSFKTGELITFIDTTNNSFDWKWDFGDGSKEVYLSKINHSFENPGLYKVKLTINNNCLVEKQIKILPNLSDGERSLFPKIKSPEYAIQGKPVQFNDLTQNATSWEWCFDADKPFKVDATVKNPTHVYNSIGGKTVGLIVNGDKKHMKTVFIFVNKKEAPVEPPPPPPPPPELKPKIPGMDEKIFISGLLGISQNNLNYENFTNYFCTKRMPQINVNEERTISLKELYEEIKGKKIKVQEVTIQKKGNCIVFINLKYR